MIQKEKKATRGDLSIRLSELPLLIIERPRTLTELQQIFGCHKRTIQRNIDALPPNYGIVEEKTGREIRYFQRDDCRYVPPSFTVGEVAALALSQQSIAAIGAAAAGTPFARHGQTLLAKVRLSLPQPLRDKLETLSTVYGTALTPAKDYSPHAETLERLAAAAAERRVVRIDYVSLDGKRSVRDLDVYAVYFDPDGGTLKALGHDHKTGDIRTFSVDHIRSMTVCDKTFVRPHGFSLRKYLDQTCFNGIHGHPLAIRLRATGATARIFSERSFHPTQTVTHCDHASTVIEMTVAGGRGLERFILSWLPEVQVLAPQSLKDRIMSICATWSSSQASIEPSR